MTDYSKWHVHCLVREIGRKWPGADHNIGLMDQLEDGVFFTRGHTMFTRRNAKNFLEDSKDWNTEEAVALKKAFRDKINAWLDEQRLLYPGTAERRRL